MNQIRNQSNFRPGQSFMAFQRGKGDGPPIRYSASKENAPSTHHSANKESAPSYNILHNIMDSGPHSHHYDSFLSLKKILKGNFAAQPSEALVQFLVAYYRDKRYGEESPEILKYLAFHGISYPDPTIAWDSAIQVKSFPALVKFLGEGKSRFLSSLLVCRKDGSSRISHRTPSFREDCCWEIELKEWKPVVSFDERPIVGPVPRLRGRRRPTIINPEIRVPIFCLQDKTWWMAPMKDCLSSLVYHALHCGARGNCEVCSPIHPIV